MNLEGNKSTLTKYQKHTFAENDEGMVIKIPVGEPIEMHGILLPVKGEEKIAVFGQEIQYMHRYLIKPHYEITIGDYFIYDNVYEVISIEKWPKYQTLLLKVIK